MNWAVEAVDQPLLSSKPVIIGELRHTNGGSYILGLTVWELPVALGLDLERLKS